MEVLLGEKYFSELESHLISYIQDLEIGNKITCPTQIKLRQYIKQNKGLTDKEKKVIIELNQEIAMSLKQSPSNRINLLLYQLLFDVYLANLSGIIDATAQVKDFLDDELLVSQLNFLFLLSKFLINPDCQKRFQYFHDLIEITPDSIEVDGWLWYLYYENLDADELINICNWFCEKTEWEKHGLFFKAFLFNQTSRYKEAAETFETIIEKTPYNDDSLLWIMISLAESYNYLENFTKSIHLNFKVIKLSELAEDKELLRLFAYTNLSHIYILKEDYSQAWKNLKEALLLDKEFPIAQDLYNKLKEIGYVD